MVHSAHAYQQAQARAQAAAAQQQQQHHGHAGMVSSPPQLQQRQAAQQHKLKFPELFARLESCPAVVQGNPRTRQELAELKGKYVQILQAGQMSKQDLMKCVRQIVGDNALKQALNSLHRDHLMQSHQQQQHQQHQQHQQQVAPQPTPALGGGGADLLDDLLAEPQPAQAPAAAPQPQPQPPAPPQPAAVPPARVSTPAPANLTPEEKEERERIRKENKNKRARERRAEKKRQNEGGAPVTAPTPPPDAPQNDGNAPTPNPPQAAVVGQKRKADEISAEDASLDNIMGTQGGEEQERQALLASIHADGGNLPAASTTYGAVRDGANACELDALCKITARACEVHKLGSGAAARAVRCVDLAVEMQMKQLLRRLVSFRDQRIGAQRVKARLDAMLSGTPAAASDGASASASTSVPAGFDARVRERVRTYNAACSATLAAQRAEEREMLLRAAQEAGGNLDEKSGAFWEKVRREQHEAEATKRAAAANEAAAAALGGSGIAARWAAWTDTTKATTPAEVQDGAPQEGKASSLLTSRDVLALIEREHGLWPISARAAATSW